LHPKNNVKDNKRNILLNLLLATRETGANNVLDSIPQRRLSTKYLRLPIRRHDLIDFPDRIRWSSALFNSSFERSGCNSRLIHVEDLFRRSAF
jgi:hypothetical protein